MEIGFGTDLVPACTPLRVTEHGSKKIVLEVANQTDWGRFNVKSTTYDEAKFDSFDACVASTPEYRGRYTSTQLGTYAKGVLEEGMPIEFVTMVLGPPRVRTKHSSLWGVVNPFNIKGEYRQIWALSVGINTLAEALRAEVSVSADDRVTDFGIAVRGSHHRPPGVPTPGTPVVEPSHAPPPEQPEVPTDSTYELGMAAYEAGDAEKAFAIWLPLAQADVERAQYTVADMYLRGDGTGQDIEEAVKWFHKAAESYYPPAQYHVGYMYAAGEGVPRDLEEAYFWFEMAASLGHEDAERARDQLAERLTAEELVTAKRRFDETNITLPTLMWALKPEYPELARVARIEGRVILQAVVLQDGTVGAVEVLSCNRPGLGFEDSAVDAVSRWFYEPARKGGNPMDVYFTVRVDFELV
jgi:TonB family protein